MIHSVEYFYTLYGIRKADICYIQNPDRLNKQKIASRIRLNYVIYSRLPVSNIHITKLTIYNNSNEQKGGTNPNV